MSKRKGQRIHAKRRAKQRYGLDLNNDQLNAIRNRITTGQAHLVKKATHRISIYQVRWEQRWLTVAYDRKRNSIASFLPEKSWEVRS